MMRINKSSEGSNWVQVSTLTTAPSFNADKFYAEFHSLGKIFDPMLFSQRLGELLERFSEAEVFGIDPDP
jgi:hypothetical protein